MLIAFLAAIAPLIGVIIYCNISIHRDAMALARNLISRAISGTTAEQDDIVAELREMLGLIATLDVARKPDLPALNVTLRQIKNTKSYLSNLFFCNRDGCIVASAVPGYLGFDASQRKYFLDPRRRDAFSFGQYIVSQVTRNPVMHFSRPVRGEDGQLSGVLVAALDLACYARLFDRLGIPDGGFLELYDCRGVRLLRHPPDDASPPGQAMSPDLAARLANETTGEGLLDGEPGQSDLVLAARQLRTENSDPEPYGTMVIGLPLAAAMESANRRLQVSILVSSTSLLLAIGLAVLLGRVVIVGRLRVLTDLVQAVEDNRICLLPHGFGDDEIGLLGRRFTSLSQELYDKSHRLTETMASLRQEKERLEDVVGQLGQAQEELERRANHDALTGLANRRAFNEMLRREFARTRRYATAFSLVLLDIDDFKVVNDTHGHWAGDAVLCRLADLVTACLRETDAAFRVGGEEFALILPETDQAQAMAMAERLRCVVAETRVRLAEDTHVAFTVSLGLAACDSAMPGKDALYKAADEALYRAKAAGKNRTMAWSPEAAASGSAPL